MTTINSTDNPSTYIDRFSWQRMWDFGNLFSNSLKRQLLVYGLLSLISAIFCLLPLSAATQMGLFSMFGSVLGFAYYLSPLVLSKWGDTRMVMNMTPALPIEKFLFFMIYFLILLPIVVFLPTLIAQYFYLKIPAVQTVQMLKVLKLSFEYEYTISKFVDGGAIVLSCFYVVLNCNGNRTLKGVLAVLGILFGLGIVGAICGFVMGFHDGYGGYAYPDALGMENILQSLRMPTTVLDIFFAIASIILMWLCYRRLAHPKV